MCRIIVEELTFEMIFIPNGLLVFGVYLLSPAWKEQQVPPVALFQRHLSINLMQFLPVPVENIFPAFTKNVPVRNIDLPCRSFCGNRSPAQQARNLIPP